MWRNILIWLVIIAAVVFLGWLTFRAWRAHNKIVKWLGTAVIGLFTIILALLSVLMLAGMVKLYPPRNVPIPAVTVAGTTEQIERGRHLASSFCAGCHSTGSRMIEWLVRLC